MEKKKINIKKYFLSKNEKKNYIRLSLTLLVGSLFSELMYTNELFLVNYIINDELVTADYRIATLLPAQLFFVTQSLLIYFMPKFVQRKHNPDILWKYSVKVGAFNFCIIMFICIVAFVITPWLIVFMYGDAYYNCIELSRNFWLAYGINAGIRIVPLNVLSSTGHEKLNAVFAIGGCIIHIAAAWVILKYFNIEALPIATAIVYIIIGIFAWYFLWHSNKNNLNMER